MERLNDKEPPIRAYAVIALSKLIGSEAPDERGPTILEILLDVASSDPAPEVRRAALVNVPVSSATVNAILSRTRDVDAVTRKLVYAGVLEKKLGQPRHLSIAQREQVVKDGLGDREPAVRMAAGKLVASWFDALLVEADTAQGLGVWEGDDGGVMKGLVHFLGLFDVIGPGEAAAVDAVLSIFTVRPDTVDAFSFSGACSRPGPHDLISNHHRAILDKSVSRVYPSRARLRRTLCKHKTRRKARISLPPCYHRIRVLHPSSV